MKMCRAFARCGVRTTLFARGDTKSPDAVFQYYGMEPEFDLALSPKHRIPLVRWAHRLFTYRLSTARRQPPDLVYGRDPAALYWLGHRLRRSFVYEAHHLPTSVLQRHIVAALIRSPWLKGVVVISDALREDIVKLYPALKRLRIVTAHDGADEHCVTTQPIDLTEPGKHYSLEAGYVGSLYGGRGIDLILALAAKMPQVRFHLLGGTPSDIAFWRESGVTDNVCFHAHRPHREVRDWLAAFDVLLAPYQPGVKIGNGYNTGRWMSPLKVFEYMAAGKPIIASDLPVLREILTNQDTGILAQPDSVYSWEAALQSVSQNARYRVRLGENAQLTLKRCFTWESRGKNIIEIFFK